jgi:hypothetical protein
MPLQDGLFLACHCRSTIYSTEIPTWLTGWVTGWLAGWLAEERRNKELKEPNNMQLN